METVWSFDTARFSVRLTITPDYGYQYDGDDENGETQAALDSGELVAFDSTVTVYLDGREVGRDDLGGSVYGAGDIAEFYTAHRDSDASNRNTLAMKATGTSIGHYFPDMVAEAIRRAREALASVPTLRSAA